MLTVQPEPLRDLDLDLKAVKISGIHLDLDQDLN